MIDSNLIAGETVDLFAGPGGWDVAAEAWDLNVVGIELDDAACQTRRAAGLNTIRGDVAALDPLDFAGITGLIASPPCQAWSRAGKRLGLLDQEHVFAAAQAMLLGQDIRARLLPRLKDERSLLAIEPLRWALALRPRWIALEQVPDVLPLWEMFAGALGARGYSTWTGKVNAADYGVPQTRERAILLASLDGRVNRPQQTHADPRPGLPLHVLPWVSMAEALGWGLSESPSGTIMSVSPNGGPRSGALDGGSGSRERYKREQREGRWVFRGGNQERATVRTPDEPAPTIAFGHSGPRWEIRTGQRSSRRELVDGVFTEVESQPYARSVDRPAPTLDSKVNRWEVRGNVPRGLKAGTNANDVERSIDQPAATLRFGARLNTVAWTVDRPATTVFCDPRIAAPGHKKDAASPDSPGRMEEAIRVELHEAAILQSFPPDYPWQGTRTKCYQQIGNAVPPLLAFRMLEEVLCDSSR